MTACKYGDPTCPCQDGQICHYEGVRPMRPPEAWICGMQYAAELCHQRPLMFGEELARVLRHKIPERK